ncbi:MAG: DUF3256 family protein [Prevotellaceae bacterium]|jgi:hypothetical protein|nr:DUF3256 family protein [Prevotellaceae bacterium]
MKKLFVLICLSWAIALHAQEAKTVFVDMPDSICPLLTAVNRADCIDFLDSKMKAEVTNRLNGKSEMTTLTADYINIRLSPNATWQLKLLAVNDTTSIIAIINTACAPACDSSIHFYTTAWKELPVAPTLIPPVMSDFVNIPADTDSYELRDAATQADMLLMKATFTPDNDVLTFTFTTPTYMNKTSSDLLKPYIHPTIDYRWNRDSQQFTPVATHIPKN